MERDHQTTLPVVLITWCLSVGSISGLLAGEFQVIGPSQPIVAVAGDDVILPCSLKPPLKITDETVVWSRPGLASKHVHVYRNRLNSVEDQVPSYLNRTSLFEGELIHGNVSLKLFRVKLEEDGKYTCLIPSYSRDEKAVIQLIVVAVSEPKISIVEVTNTGLILQCEAKSWYPEPQLDWREGPKDSEGRLLSADVTQTHREPDGRYTVRSSMTVQKTDTNKFTCRVQLKKHNLTREAEFHVPGNLCPTDPSLVVVSVVVVVLVIVGAAAFLYHYHCQKKSTQRVDSNGTDIERGGDQGTNDSGEKDDQTFSGEACTETESSPLQELDPDTRKTNRGPREGQDSGLSSRAESNATLASLVER